MRPAAMLLCLVVSMTTLALTLGKDQDYKCPEGWTLYEEGQTCLRIQSDYKSWEDAREVCKETNGGDLVKISDPEMSNFVHCKVAKHRRYWIGLNDLDKDGKFQWLDEQEQPSYFDWQRGKQTSVKKHHCVETLVAKGGSWNERKCSRRRPFICQTNAEKVFPLTAYLPRVCTFRDLCGYQVIDSDDVFWKVLKKYFKTRNAIVAVPILLVDNSKSTPGEFKLHSISATGLHKCVDIRFFGCTHGMTFRVSGQGFNNFKDCNENSDHVLLDLQPSDTFTLTTTVPAFSRIDFKRLTLFTQTCKDRQ